MAHAISSRVAAVLFLVATAMVTAPLAWLLQYQQDELRRQELDAINLSAIAIDREVALLKLLPAIHATFVSASKTDALAEANLKAQLESSLTPWLQGSELLFGACIAIVPPPDDPPPPPGAPRGMAPYVFRLPLGVQYDNLNKPGYNYLDPKWSWYQVPIQTGRSTWSPLYFDERGGGDYMITYSVPARRSGRVSAVCTVDVGWPQLIAGIQRLRYHGGQVSADEASFLLYSPTSAEAPIASPIPLLQAPGPQSQTDGDLIRNALSNNIPVLNAIQTPPFGQTSVTVPNGRLVKILFARIPSMNATLLYTRILSSSDGLREHIGAASAIGGVLFGVLAAVVILLSLRNHSGHLPPN